MVGYNWKPINDLPDHWNLLVQEDVQSLASVWNDQAKKIRDSSSFHDFLERLKRRWAIETGIIEG
ncbi:MAG TPA: Fic family protein, partial [bacterium]|nr:Fic family protein [bacterium]